MLYSCTHMTTVGVKGLSSGWRGTQSWGLDAVFHAGGRAPSGRSEAKPPK